NARRLNGALTQKRIQCPGSLPPADAVPTDSSNTVVKMPSGSTRTLLTCFFSFYPSSTSAKRVSIGRRKRGGDVPHDARPKLQAPRGKETRLPRDRKSV